MIKFRDEFVATRYPGYFWNTQDKQLYSIKVDGILTPLKKRKANYWIPDGDYYQISVKGKKRCLMVESLERLGQQRPKVQVIPVASS